MSVSDDYKTLKGDCANTKLVDFNGFIVRKNTLDESIVDNVWRHNEYRLPEEMSEIDIVIDVGAHIGSFSVSALQRGAKHVIAVEADIDNYELAKINLQKYIEEKKVTLLNAAVWRSDIQELRVSLGNYPFHEELLNSGGKTVVEVGGENSIEAIGLDALLIRYASKDSDKILLKLDCEGSEWPILYTSNYLGWIYAICGELHCSAECELLSVFMKSEGNVFKRTPAALKSFLEQQNFKFKFLKVPPSSVVLGLFWAINQEQSKSSAEHESDNPDRSEQSIAASSTSKFNDD